MSPAQTLLCSGALSLLACGPAPSVRSPSVDYPPPPPQTADGEVVGVDRAAPGDTLGAGAQVGSGGVTTQGRAAREPAAPLPPIPADDPRCRGVQNGDDPFVRGRCLKPAPPAPSAR